MSDSTPIAPAPVRTDEDLELTISPARLAAYWNVSVRTIYRDIQKGALPAVRRGRSMQLRIRLSEARKYGRPVE